MKKYCVVSGKHNACGRTWRAEQSEALADAARIMDNDKSCNKLFIVEVVAVVERPVPMVESRLPREEDLQ